MALAQEKGFLFGRAIKKTAGQATPVVGTQINLPMAAANPRNPDNISYPAVINSQGAPSISIAGKKTPSVALVGIPLKSSFFAGAAGVNLLADLIGAAVSFLDTNNNTSEYAVGFLSDQGVWTVYDGCKCVQLSLYQTAPGGGIMLDLSFLSIYGDSEKGTPTTFATPTTDSGSALDVTNVLWTPVTDVYNWRLTLLRPQAYQPTADGTLYMGSIESGMVGGNLRVVMNSNPGETVISTSATIQISTGGGAGTGVQIALNLKRDDRQRDIPPALLSRLFDYSLINSSPGYPIAISTF